MSFEKRLLSMATLASHSNFVDRGFRQKDVKFAAELLTNWTDVFTLPDKPQWHNTQVMRFLAVLVENGHAQVKRGSKVYKLTRLGLLELTMELVGQGGYYNTKNTLCIYFFLRTYKDRLVHLIEREGSGFSKAVRVEIKQLIDHQYFLQQQGEAVDQQIRRIELRLEDTNKARELAEKLSRQGQDVNQIVEDVARLYPYELESQKPMEELFHEITPELRLWEIIEGNKFRAKILWEAQIDSLRQHRQLLSRLAKTEI